ncbi:phage tail protein [Enterobacter roggenkampii]|uniref:phage tail protein n=1 Tax=Enterobacter roggenkampii TaxID=1812935 RepID=UPI00214AD065|nr:phage tail protein [Enterobacter roggenkampii]
MTAKYFAILTNQGAARLANAVSLGTKLNLTQMAVGDANGVLPTPDPAQTKLINQKRIAPLNQLSIDPGNDSQIIAEQIIPENEGGFWIREIGLYDDDGILIAVANCPETYKPQLQEGSGRTQTIRMILIVSATSAITLKIDPSVVLATRQYVDSTAIKVKGYTDDLISEHVRDANPHTQYPLIENALKEMVDAGVIGEVLQNLGLGDRLLEANGFFELPGGFLLQWGSGSVQATNATVRFKKPFNVTPFIVLPHKITADNRYVTSVNYTLTGFSLYGWNGSGVATNIDSYTYFALGV